MLYTLCFLNELVFLPADKEPVCSVEQYFSGRMEYDCQFTNKPVSVVCSFDGGPLENCSFPLPLNVERFGVGNHTAEVTVVDKFEKSNHLRFDFIISDSESLCPISGFA